ncbi:N-6 DNA methylase [Gemmiger sp.]|uniref:N-6 DNA methylase n=1 Tax=Gemmiger sp. TaxID=2049027 RepID=UPI003AB89BD6
MANYQNILRQAHQAIADVADNADSWRAFLRSAAYTTHYAFPNQALIYSQRPGATMLADIDTWNRAAGRWVNRGARGVASLGTGHMAGNVRYLFDIKDTHPAGKASKPLGWQITDANRYPTLQALQEKHNAESLPEIFGLQVALFVAQHGKQLDADLQNAEAAYEAYQERYKPKPVEKRPLAAGDTVYLENDHPFTVEEIGIFDVHLRDEDFPLIGRAVNRAEFARLLAANPKNQALAAPELPNAPDAGEAAEVVEGEVLEPAEETSSGFGEQVLQAAELIALKEAYLPNNYIPSQDPAPPRTPREKFAANITAIRTLKSIEKRMADGGPHANGEEQEILAQYSGWGGLSDAFEPNKDSWHSEYTELKSLLTEEEYAAARSSTLTAFYTPPEVIDAMYTALRKMGVGAGTILEPSMGVGAFFGQSHSYLYEPTTRLFGVELDSLTGRIARQLYQKANIQITGFEKADLPDSFFDVVIGNVPFGDYSVVDPQYNRLHFKIHDYFFAKSIDKLRTGGIIAFVTTSGTLDKKSEEVRKYINARCDFIGAVRLPDSTFKSAGTKAMADIIFLQKRDRILEQDAGWLHTTQTEDGLSLNSYFAERPEMVCGTLKTVSGPYSPALTCEAFDDKPLADVLKEAMSHLHAEFHFQDIFLHRSCLIH